MISSNVELVSCSPCWLVDNVNHKSVYQSGSRLVDNVNHKSVYQSDGRLVCRVFLILLQSCVIVVYHFLRNC